MQDFPFPAYTKACQVVDDFDALAAEYLVLLDTQSAMLANENYGGIAHHTARGDAIARRVASYGGQLQSLRATLSSGRYSGARTNDLLVRFDRVRTRADVVRRTASRLAAACAVQRDLANASLKAETASVTKVSASVNAYRAFDRGVTSFDVAV